MSDQSAASAQPSTEPGDPCPVCDAPCATCNPPDGAVAAILLTFDDGLELPPGGQILARAWPGGLMEGDARDTPGGTWMPVVFRGGRAEMAP